MSDAFTQSLLNRDRTPAHPPSSSPLLATIYRGSGWVSAVGCVVCIGVALTSEGVWQMMAGVYAALCVVWSLFGFGMAQVIDLIGEIAANTGRERNDEVIGVLRRIEAHLAARKEISADEKSDQSNITWGPRP
jgi:hypothetical protein